MEWLLVLVGGIEPPPVRYDTPPERPVLVKHVPEWEVDVACRWAHPELASIDLEIRACSKINGLMCVVTLPWPGDVGAERYAELMRHELAHCNGWFHD